MLLTVLFFLLMGYNSPHETNLSSSNIILEFWQSSVKILCFEKKWLSLLLARALEPRSLLVNGEVDREGKKKSCWQNLTESFWQGSHREEVIFSVCSRDDGVVSLVKKKKRQSKLISQLVSLIERSDRQMGKKKKKKEEKDKEGLRRGLIKLSSFT